MFRVSKTKSAARTPSQNHHRHLNANSTIFITLARDLKGGEDYLLMTLAQDLRGVKTTFPRYKLPIHYRFWTTVNFVVVSLLNHKSKCKTYSYFTLQPRGHFREPMTYYHNLSVSCKLLSQALICLSMKQLPSNPLTTDDKHTCYATLAAWYQLVESIFRIGFMLAIKVGYI